MYVAEAKIDMTYNSRNLKKDQHEGLMVADRHDQLSAYYCSTLLLFTVACTTRGLMSWPVLALALTAAVAKRRALLASRALVVPDFGCTIGTENSGSFAVALLFKGFQDLQCLLHISTISFCNQDVGHPLQSIQRRPWLAVVVSDVLLDIGEITCLAHEGGCTLLLVIVIIMLQSQKGLLFWLGLSASNLQS